MNFCSNSLNSVIFGIFYLVQCVKNEEQEIICSNGRKGTDFAGNTICICDESFFGPFCTQQKPCVNGKYKNFKCVCYDNYQGEECRLPICENGHLLLGTDICVCDKGYMGTHCELCHFDYERVRDVCRRKIDLQYPDSGRATAKSKENGGTEINFASPVVIGGIIAATIGLCGVAFGTCAYRKRQAELRNVGLNALEHQESFPGTWSKNRISSFLDSIYVPKHSSPVENARHSRNSVENGDKEIMITSCQAEVINEDCTDLSMTQIVEPNTTDTEIQLDKSLVHEL